MRIRNSEASSETGSEGKKALANAEVLLPPCASPCPLWFKFFFMPEIRRLLDPKAPPNNTDEIPAF
jgi:hypothetical protein